MADFVAVIRRAVDGLSDNTPEMRVKVYERARGAVQRQLENMKPRPPEDMLRRQLDKLEVAIREVEEEHAEALPGIEEPAAAAVSAAPIEPEPVAEEAAPVAHAEAAPEPVEEAPAYAPEPAYEEPVHQEPAHEEPVYEEPAPTEPVYEAPAHAEEPVYHEAAHVEAEPVHEELPEPAHVEPELEAEPERRASSLDAVLDSWHTPGEEEQHVETWHAPEPAVADHAVHDLPQHDEVPEEPRYAEPVAVAEEQVHSDWAYQPVSSEVQATEDVYHEAVEDLVEPVDEAPPEHIVEEARHAPEPAGTHSFDDVWPEPEPHVVAPAPTPAPPPALVQPLTSAPKAAAVQPPADAFAWGDDVFAELPPVPQRQGTAPLPADSFDDVDLFSDVQGSAAKAAPKDEVPGDGWRELKELAGYDRLAAEEPQAGGRGVPPDLDHSIVQKLQGKSFRMEPKRRRFSLPGILLGLAGVLIVAGGGYAAWENRGALNTMVTDLVKSAPKTATVADKAPTTPQPAATETAKATPPAAATDAKAPAAAQPAANNAGTEVASAGADSVNTKFTQRLMADGTETDDGPAVVPGQPTAAEGKSVAQQNVAAATPAAPAQAAQPGTATPAQAGTAAPSSAPATAPAAADAASANAPAATAPATTTPAPTQQAGVVGSPEKMFLYEERLGQASPTAIEGTVTWTALEEKGDDGRPEPAVQGNITVPERGLTAIITFKRNTDPSLPASHLVELVFSVPPNFEGGAIDSVQRIAMKATEQDRGDALIAVPAKITDDFHMVALNDFPDARKTNLDLLRTRSWIDIPLTYRNGRRALLTLSKGATGTDAFNKVIGEWTARGDLSSNQ